MNDSSNMRGFTMVEVAFSLMVASIGLLGLLSLFPPTVNMNKDSFDETRAAMFAEEVFNGIRAQASTTRWDRIKTGIDLPPPTQDKWVNPQMLRIRNTGNNFETLRYRTVGAVTGGNTAYSDFAMRYRLQVVGEVADPLKSIYLDIRPGEYGENTTYRFYTELYNHGQQ